MTGAPSERYKVIVLRLNLCPMSKYCPGSKSWLLGGCAFVQSETFLNRVAKELLTSTELNFRVKVSKCRAILNPTESKSSPSTEVHLNWKILKRTAFISTFKQIRDPATRRS